MKYANEEELQCVVDYITALGGDRVEWKLRHQPGIALLIEKCGKLGFKPIKLGKGDFVAKLRLADGYLCFVEKGEKDFVLRDKVQAREWAINRAAEIRLETLEGKKALREQQLYELRGAKGVEEGEMKEEMLRYKQWLSALPLVKMMNETFEVKTMKGGPADRAKLNNYAKARGVVVSIMRDTWLKVIALRKEEKEHRFVEFDELERGQSFYYAKEQMNWDRLERACVRFNRLATDKRLSWRMNNGICSVTRIL